MTNDTVFVDTETTGLCSSDEIVEIAIVNAAGDILLNSLVKPVNHKTWPEAQAIHGISPDMVKDAPTYAELASQIADCFRNKEVVIYNAEFDSMFLHKELEVASSVRCCMLDFAEDYGEWNDYHGNHRGQKLTKAANYVLHEWTGEAHRALADTLAARSVWQYLNDPEVKQRVERHWKQKKIESDAERELGFIDYQRRMSDDRNAYSWDKFLKIWWLRESAEQHWSNQIPQYSVRAFYCKLFFDKPEHLVEMENQAETVYRKKADIPAHLVAKSHFRNKINPLCGQWFEKKLKPTNLAFVTNKVGWWLYDISEYERIEKMYPLRLNYPKMEKDEMLIHQTEAKRCGISLKDKKPVFHTFTQYGQWYLLYKVKASQVYKDQQEQPA